tara:strand:+ start:174 stop:803 length:630 start_codon:yes stop_codon:yes gene_type:complete
MTLMNGLMYQGKAYLWVDTAIWDTATGERIGHTEKAFMGNLWPWAAVHTGHADTQDLHKLARRMAERPNLTAEGLIRDATEVLQMEADEGRLGRLLLAYPCPEYGARITLISNRDLPPIAKAYAPTDAGSFICSGRSEDWARDWMPIFDEGDPTPDDVRRFIREQAKHPFDTEDGWNIVGIGGNIIEIEVSPLGVQSCILYNVDEPEAT